MPGPAGQPYRGAYLQDRLSNEYGPQTKAQLEANLDRIYKLLRIVNRNGELPEGTESDLLVFTDGVWTVLPFTATNQRVIGNSTGVPAWEQVSLTAGVSGRLPFSSLVQVAASKLVGRGSASGTGDAEEISLGSGLSMSGTTLAATAISGYHYEPVVGGSVADPELLFNAAGDIIMQLVADY